MKSNIVAVPMCHRERYSPARNVAHAVRKGKLLYWTDMVFDPAKYYHFGHMRLADGTTETFFLENILLVAGKDVKKVLVEKGWPAVNSGELGKFYFRRDAAVRLTPMRTGETLEAERYYLPANMESEPSEHWSRGVHLQVSQVIP